MSSPLPLARRALWLIALALAPPPSCAEPPPAEPPPTCVVVEEGADAWAVYCADGTTAVFSAGADGLAGAGCAIDGDELRCSDGTSVTLPRAEDGALGASCTAEPLDDGWWAIVCSDGTSATLYTGGDGADGSGCTVERFKPLIVVLSCDDGTSVVLRVGLDGDGGDGCLVETTASGDVRLFCTDGTEVLLHQGQDAAHCTVTELGDGRIRVDCPDGSSATSPVPESAGWYCAPTAYETGPCGLCGWRQRTCTSEGAWGPWGACHDQGECSPEATEELPCGTDVGACSVGTQRRVCASDCTWGPWSDCSAPLPVEMGAERCDNGLDDDCDGHTDEGCVCAPVPPGQVATVDPGGEIVGLWAHPKGCSVYGLRGGASPAVIRLDSLTHAVAAARPLGEVPEDMSVDPTGFRVAVAVGGAIQVLDAETLAPVTTIGGYSQVESVQLTDPDTLYFVTRFSDGRRASVATGEVVDVFEARLADLALSPDGRHLYAGESGTTDGGLHDIAIDGAAIAFPQLNQMFLPYTFPDKHVHVSPDGERVHYAGVVHRADRLRALLGAHEDRTLAEDAASTFVVGPTHLHDARVFAPVRPLPVAEVSGAALAAGDGELWLASTAEGAPVEVHNVGDLLAGIALGSHARPTAALDSYRFVALAHDPQRRRIYGVDEDARRLVAIDEDSAAPIGAWVVAPGPSALAVSRDGSYLFVGHRRLPLIERVDLEQLQVDGTIALEVGDLPTEALVMLQGDRLVTTGWRSLHEHLVLLATPGGEVLDYASGSSDARTEEGRLAPTADGATLYFTGGWGPCRVGRVTLVGDTLAYQSCSASSDACLPDQELGAVAVPDGSGVFLRGVLAGPDACEVRYALGEEVRFVTADSALALSATHVYSVASGQALGALPWEATAFVESGDGTWIWGVTEAGLQRVARGALCGGSPCAP